MSMDLDRLVATATIEDTPPAPSSKGRGRPPLYLPLLERIYAAAGKAVRFGPVPQRTDAERIRAGMSAYATDHPELLPPGFTGLRFTVRAEADQWVIYGWCDAA